MDAHGKKKMGVWLSVLAVLIPLVVQIAGTLLAWTRWGLAPLFWGAALVLLAVAVLVMAAALVRIREINGGEEDDLSQY